MFWTVKGLFNFLVFEILWEAWLSNTDTINYVFHAFEFGKYFEQPKVCCFTDGDYDDDDDSKDDDGDDILSCKSLTQTRMENCNCRRWPSELNHHKKWPSKSKSSSKMAKWVKIIIIYPHYHQKHCQTHNRHWCIALISYEKYDEL